GWSRDDDVVFSGNPSSWTLSLEAFFYLTHPWIDRLLGRTGRRVALGVLLALPVLAAVLYLARSEIPALQDLPRPVLRLWEFCLGMALAHTIRLGWRPRIPVPLALGALLVVCAGIFLGPIMAPELWEGLRLGALAPVLIPAACAVVICA